MLRVKTHTQNMGDFLESGLLEPAAAPLVRREVQSLCLELRPEAISLTDAWQFTDKYLSSALGRSDGYVCAVCCVLCVVRL